MLELGILTRSMGIDMIKVEKIEQKTGGGLERQKEEKGNNTYGCFMHRNRCD